MLPGGKQLGAESSYAWTSAGYYFPNRKPFYRAKHPPFARGPRDRSVDPLYLFVPVISSDGIYSSPVSSSVGEV